MVPKILCASCGHPLSPDDQFCGNCGEKVVWERHDRIAVSSRTLTCKLCGTNNPVGSSYCEVCGAALEDRSSRSPTKEERTAGLPSAERKGTRSGEKRRPTAARGLAGWKVIAFVGTAMVLGLVFIAIKRNQPVTLKSESPAPAVASEALLREIEQARKLVQAQPSNPAAVLKLANLLHDGRLMNEAIEYYKKYLQLNEKDPDARVDLGICYYETGNPTAAIAEMEKALMISPKHQLAHFNLGIVNLGSGNVERAIDWFNKCIALAPESETARRARNLINQHIGTGNAKLN